MSVFKALLLASARAAPNAEVVPAPTPSPTPGPTPTPTPGPTPTPTVQALTASADWNGTKSWSGRVEPTFSDAKRGGTWPYEPIVSFHQCDNEFNVGTTRITVETYIGNLSGMDSFIFWWEGGSVTLNSRTTVDGVYGWHVDLVLPSGNAGGLSRVWGICLPSNGRAYGTFIDNWVVASDTRPICYVDNVRANDTGSTGAIGAPYKNLNVALRSFTPGTLGARFKLVSAGDYPMLAGASSSGVSALLAYDVELGAGRAPGDCWITNPAGAADVTEATMRFGVRVLRFTDISADIANCNAWLPGGGEVYGQRGMTMFRGNCDIKDRRGMNGARSYGFPIGFLGTNHRLGLSHAFFNNQADTGTRIAFLGTTATPLRIEATNIGGVYMMRNVTGKFGMTSHILSTHQYQNDARRIDVDLMGEGNWFIRQHDPEQIAVASVGAFDGTYTTVTFKPFAGGFHLIGYVYQLNGWVLTGACAAGNRAWPTNRDGSPGGESTYGWEVEDFPDGESGWRLRFKGDMSALVEDDLMRIMYDDHGGDNNFAQSGATVGTPIARNWAHIRCRAEHPGLQTRLNQPWVFRTSAGSGTFSFDATTNVGTFGAAPSEALMAGMTVVTATGWGTVRKVLTSTTAEFYENLDHQTGAVQSTWPASFSGVSWSRGRDVVGWGQVSNLWWSKETQNADVQQGCNHFYLGCSLIALAPNGLSYAVDSLGQIVGVKHIDCIFGKVYEPNGLTFPDGWVAENSHYRSGTNRDVGAPAGHVSEPVFAANGRASSGVSRVCTIAGEVLFDRLRNPRTNGVSVIGANVA